MSLLADGLVDRGHDVTLFASGDSRTSAKLACVYEEAPSSQIGLTTVELNHALACFARADEFDVINDHSGPLAAAVGASVETPLLHTVHGSLGGIEGDIYERVVDVSPTLGLISVSLNQRRPCPRLPWVANCPNAIDLDAYPFQAERGDYLLFLGRMSPDKGCHRAIEVARAAGLPLKIVAKKRERLEQEYFDALVKPALGRGIEYLGETTHAAKVELLQNARATLFPIEWDEPFGLVILEAMACGSAVIAIRRGAVREIIDHGRSGIIVDDYREMADAIAEADRLDPHVCRRHVEEHFAPTRMVLGYEKAYESVLDRVAT